MVAEMNKSLLWAACMSGILFVVKGLTYLLTGSNLILGSCLDSFSDSIVSLINFKVQRESFKSPDKEHPFGHGGFEVLSSLAQGILLASIGLFLIFESIQAIITTKQIELDSGTAPIAIGVLLFAAITGFAIHWYLDRSSHDHRSLSLEADKAHYIGDFWQNILSMIGVAVVWWTGWQWADGVFGVLVGLMFIKVATPILLASSSDVSSRQFTEEQKEEITKIAIESDPRIAGIHRLRSRELGPNKFVDFHMKLPDEMPLKEAHDLGEVVVKNLENKISHLDVIIHLDPASEPDDDLW